MFKKPITYWIIAILLFIGLLVVEYRTGRIESRLDQPDDIAFLYLRTIPEVIAFLIIGSVLSALIALIPFKSLKYIIKFWIILPISVSLLICYMIYAYKTETKKFEYEESDGSSKDYNKVEMADSVSCLSVHEGKFETKTLIIERKGENQTQVRRGETDTLNYKVKWVSACEYYLLPNGDSTGEVLEVKIFTVTRKGYDCYVTLRGREDRTGLYHLKKINDPGEGQ